ncbi:MAG: glycosyltransferase family 4 protein [Gammaproteobacteria bacterium]|nr:glycosyltransferase family 4 protein [Gammaproteobacteria bacterium]
MRIGFDAKRAFFNNRGLGNYSRTLIRDLSLYFPQYEYLLYSAKPAGDERKAWLSQLGKVQTRLPSSVLGKKLSAVWRMYGLASAASKDKIDIFHGLSHELPYGIHKRTQIRSVVTVHDLLFLKHPEFHKWVDRKIYMRKLRYACQAADKIVAVSEQTKRDLQEYLSIAPEKISVVYQSCDQKFFDDSLVVDSQDVYSKFGLPQNFIFYVGALTESKNLDSLLQAYASFASRTDCSLVLAGNGSYKKSLQASAAKLGLSEKVFFPGYIPNEDLPQLYKAAKLFVYPSLYEGFGIPIIESMCMGTPVIASTGSCFTETGGDAAALVDCSDVDTLARSITEIVNNADLAQEMIDQGKVHTRKFQPKVCAENMMSVYQGLL